MANNKYNLHCKLLFILCAGLNIFLLVSCAIYSAEEITINDKIDKMYSTMSSGDYSYFEKCYASKTSDAENPFKLYNIEIFSFELVSLDYVNEKRANAKMKLSYRYEGKKIEEFEAIDVWQKMNNSWTLVDFNMPLDDRQEGINYRVEPYIYVPGKFNK